MSDKSAFHPLLPNEEERYKPISADLTCRKCGKKSKVQLRACVNVSLHPEEKEQILNGSFFKFTCPDCGEQVSIMYPCLYDDMSLALMVYLLPDDTEDALEKMNAQQDKWSPEMLKAAMVCTMRAVRNTNELCEKIKIFDNGLDDRYIELTKAFVFSQFAKQNPDIKVLQVLYERKDGKDGFVIITKDEKTLFAEIPEGLYDEIIRLFKDVIPKKKTEYELIDAGWTMKILESRNPNAVKDAPQSEE
ncbi:MAG: CpXC domain-containing protein [Clostridiales bacterium]|nr:CpXC domain-containing protein [Clostridiales bacterium]